MLVFRIAPSETPEWLGSCVSLDPWIGEEVTFDFVLDAEAEGYRALSQPTITGVADSKGHVAVPVDEAQVPATHPSPVERRGGGLGAQSRGHGCVVGSADLRSCLGQELQ